MRVIIFLVVLSLFDVKQSSAQKTDRGKVPIPVQKFFMVRYPDRKHEEFVLIGDTMYEVSFNIEYEKHKAYFLANGTWIGEETIMAVPQLKPLIVEYIKKEYPDYIITLASKAVDEHYKQFYKIIINKKKEEMELRFSEDGEVMK